MPVSPVQSQRARARAWDPLPEEGEEASPVVSRHTAAAHVKWDVHALNINAWCFLPGSPFSAGLRIKPNSPGAERVAVTFGSVRFGEKIDTITFFVRSAPTPRHENRLRIELSLLDAAFDATARQTVTLGCGEERVVSLPVNRSTRNRVALRVAVDFERYEPGSPYGNVQLPYLLAYPGNELIDLFNAVESDKGTAVAFGGAVPHCYAVDYHRLFTPLRHETFSMVEIGLENQSKETGVATRARSLEVWREFFPQATLYGFDINDFSGVRQDRTITFQGDQSSRSDLQRFVSSCQPESLRLVIDDGSHASSHQQISLAALFPQLEPGGLYVIEDLQWQPTEERPRTLDLLNEFRRVGRIESPFVSPGEAEYLEQHIASCRIYKPNDAEFAVLVKAG